MNRESKAAPEVPMCNLYSMTRSRDEVARLFRVSHNRAVAFEPLHAIFPGHIAPVVRQAADGSRELSLLSWGFVLLQPGRAPKRVTNVRDDNVFSPFWRDSFEERRCLVPASSFCEPKGERPATWHWFALKGDEPRPLFAFPGLWRRWRGPLKKRGPAVDLDVYAFLTTLPNALVATVNHERMPVLLTQEDQFEAWLNGSPQEASFSSPRAVTRSACALCSPGAIAKTCSGPTAPRPACFYEIGAQAPKPVITSGRPMAPTTDLSA